MGTGHLQRLPRLGAQGLFPSQGKGSSPSERWYETGEGERGGRSERRLLGSAPPLREWNPASSSHLGADYSISLRLLPLGFSPFSPLPFGNLLWISTSAKEGLGLWKKADFKGRTSLSFSQTGRYRSMYGKVETSEEKWNVRDLAVFFFTQVKIQQIAF